ncbi:MAG: hypothetical protein R3B48_14680 [Kofleriaceae bacterium]
MTTFSYDSSSDTLPRRARPLPSWRRAIATARRVAPLALLALALTPTFACDDPYTAVYFTAPREADGGEALTLKVVVDTNEYFYDDYRVTLHTDGGELSPSEFTVSANEQVSVRFVPENRAQMATITATFQDGKVYGTHDIKVHQIERVGNTATITQEGTEESYLTAYPLEVQNPGTLHKVAIVAPYLALAKIGIYGNVAAADGDTPGAALVRLEEPLQVGVNELVVDPQALPTGKYWMVVTYAGMVSVARGGATVHGRFLAPWRFGDELPDVMPAMTKDDAMQERSFYIVVRR